MDDILFIMCLFLIIILFFVTIYYFYKVEYFSFDCEEEEIQSNGGICKPYYGMAPAQAINPYKKNDTVFGLATTTDDDRFNKNKDAIKIACMSDPKCKGFFINNHPNSDNEGYLCKPEWDGSSYTRPVVDEDVDFILYKCKNRTEPSSIPAPTVPPHTHAPSDISSSSPVVTPPTIPLPTPPTITLPTPPQRGNKTEGEYCEAMATPSECIEGLECRVNYVWEGWSRVMRTTCTPQNG